MRLLAELCWAARFRNSAAVFGVAGVMEDICAVSGVMRVVPGRSVGEEGGEGTRREWMGRSWTGRWMMMMTMRCDDDDEDFELFTYKLKISKSCLGVQE